MSLRVARTKRFWPATEQSWRASFTACATSAGLHPPAASASAAAKAPVAPAQAALPLVMAPPATQRYHPEARAPLQSGERTAGVRPSDPGAAEEGSMPVALTDAEIQEAERRARAALRSAPPTLSPGEGQNHYTLEAQHEVID